MTQISIDGMSGYYIFLLGGAVILIVTVFVVLRDSIFSKKLLNSRPVNEEDTEQKENEKKESKVNVSYGKVYLYFGSQTGTAARFCKLLAEEAENNQFEPVIVNLSDFDSSTFIDPKLAIFCMASHGQGEPTDNAVEFYKWLSSDERSTEALKNLKFSVFGLGNKQYQFYNAMGKKTNALLDKLGGERIYRYGEGDDDGSLEDDFNEWKANLWEELKQKIQSHEIDEIGESKKAEAPFSITFAKDDVKEVEFDKCLAEGNGKVYDFQAQAFLECREVKIIRAFELRQNNDEGSTIHMEFDIKGSGLKYSTAANLTVFPENDPTLVEEMARRIGAGLDQIFVIEESNKNPSSVKFKHPIPTPISVRTYLTRFCDFQGPLEKNILSSLAKYAKNEEEKEKFLRMASPAGKGEYETEISGQMKGLCDIIIDYDIKIDLKELISLAGIIKPRYFTICSSAAKNPDSIHICGSLVELKAGRKQRLGLASGYYQRILEQLTRNPDTQLTARINIKESTFYLPTDSSRPLILVGPGSGVAPFRGFLHEKEFLLQNGENKQYGDITLYFGCRKSNSDYIYKEELQHFQEIGIIDKYYVAFSREGEQKCYVQDLMRNHVEDISKVLFEQNGSLYLCGGVRMGNDVITGLGKLAAKYFNVSILDGELRIKQLEQERRIVKELWN